MKVHGYPKNESCKNRRKKLKQKPDERWGKIKMKKQEKNEL